MSHVLARVADFAAPGRPRMSGDQQPHRGEAKKHVPAAGLHPVKVRLLRVRARRASQTLQSQKRAHVMAPTQATATIVMHWVRMWSAFIREFDETNPGCCLNGRIANRLVAKSRCKRIRHPTPRFNSMSGRFAVD